MSAWAGTEERPHGLYLRTSSGAVRPDAGDHAAVLPSFDCSAVRAHGPAGESRRRSRGVAAAGDGAGVCRVQLVCTHRIACHGPDAWGDFVAAPGRRARAGLRGGDFCGAGRGRPPPLRYRRAAAPGAAVVDREAVRWRRVSGVDPAMVPGGAARGLGRRRSADRAGGAAAAGRRGRTASARSGGRRLDRRFRNGCAAAPLQANTTASGARPQPGSDPARAGMCRRWDSGQPYGPLAIQLLPGQCADV